VAAVDEKETVRLIRSFARAYWQQLNLGSLRRECLIGDLKGEGRRVRGWRVFASYGEFRAALEAMLKEGPAEVYGTLELYGQGEVEARILAFDIDGKENDLSNLKPVYELWRLLRDELGVLARVKLSGGGIHVEGPPLAGLEPVHARLLATYLEERLGGRLKLDRNIYGERHMLRLAWSWHSGRKCFAMVLKPEWLLDCSIEDLRERASDPEFLEYAYSVAPREARVLDAEKLRKVAGVLSGGGVKWEFLRVGRKKAEAGPRGALRELSEAELEELFSILRPFYEPGHRHDMVKGLSGLAAKLGVHYISIVKLAARLHRETNDERKLEDRIAAIVYTYARAGWRVDKKLIAEIVGFAPRGPGEPQQGYRVKGSGHLLEVFKAKEGEERARELLMKVERLLAGKPRAVGNAAQPASSQPPLAGPLPS
jgi:hypothetical protein